MTYLSMPLGELGDFRNGLNYSKTNEGRGLKVITVKNFGDRRIPDFTELDEINPNGVNTKNSTLVAGDIIFVRSNGNKDLVGRSMYIEETVPNVSYSGFCIRYRIHSDRARPRFLASYFRSPHFRRKLSNLGGGTNINNLNQQVMKKLEVDLPSLREQDSIISILSAYDDLIENNRRRITLLEESALNLYKEWFVRFRFPGHEHVPLVDGVPEGWEPKPFSELGEFLNGFAFKPHHLGDEGLPVVKIPELKNGVTSKTPFNSGEAVPEKYRLNDGDLLFSWSGTLAVNLWASGPALLNQHLFKVSSRGDVSNAFLMTGLREALPRFLNETTGATMKHIRRSALDKVFAVVPPEPLLGKFEKFAKNTYQQTLTLSRQINELQNARNLLLPKLVNGEIAV